MPRLWSETIDAHRRTVRDAVLDSAEALLADRGLASLTMSEIAQATGIGRATLYKYFPDVEAIAIAWHERLIDRELERLMQVSRQVSGPGDRLRAVLEAYAKMYQEGPRHHPPELVTPLLHHASTDPAHAHAHAGLWHFLSDLVAAAARAGEVRRDVPAEELAAYCLHALRAAPELGSEAAVHRLVDVTLAGLRSPERPSATP